MKRKTGIAIAAFLAAAGVVALLLGWKADFSKEKNGTGVSAATESGTEERDFDLPLQEEEKKRLYADITAAAKSCATVDAAYVYAENTTLEQEKREQLAQAIAKKGITSGLFDNESNFYDYEAAETEIKKMMAGKQSDFSIIQIYPDGRLLDYRFSYDGNVCLLSTAIAVWEGGGESKITYYNKCRLLHFDYTKKGWFLFERSVPQDTTEVVEGSEMLRIRPIEQSLREICEKYILPVSYIGNNLFLTDWDETDMSGLDFTGLYDTFYRMDYGDIFFADEALAGIPKEEFETEIEKHLAVSDSFLEQYAAYDSTKALYPWKNLGCGNYHPDMWATPIPEVVDVETLPDGSRKVTVDAVWVENHTDRAFSHEVILSVEEDGTVRYHSNTILPSEENVFPQYEMRLKGNAKEDGNNGAILCRV